MDRITSYVRTIRRHYPALHVENAVFNEEGQYNDVLIADVLREDILGKNVLGEHGLGAEAPGADRVVFRFARVPAAIETLRHEIALQTALKGRLPLPIPEPLYARVDTDQVDTEGVGEAFVGYRLIPGRPLWREAFQAIADPGARAGLAGQLARFLHALHHVPVEEVGPMALPRHETPEEMADLFRRIRDRLFEHMRPDARRTVTAHFRPYLEAPERYPFEPRLRHGDFGTGNILYDPEGPSIAGILDFGGAGIGDPAVDFAGLLICYGEGFYRQCSAVYPDMAAALERAEFYRGTFALQEALFGAENGDRGAFERGMAGYV